MMLYKYGMRLRGASPGAQPSDVFKYEDDPKGIYYDILYYDRELSTAEIARYELDFLAKEDRESSLLIRQYCSDNRAYLSPDLVEALLEGAKALCG